MAKLSINNKKSSYFNKSKESIDFFHDLVYISLKPLVVFSSKVHIVRSACLEFCPDYKKKVSILLIDRLQKYSRSKRSEGKHNLTRWQMALLANTGGKGSKWEQGQFCLSWKFALEMLEDERSILIQFDTVKVVG